MTIAAYSLVWYSSNARSMRRGVNVQLTLQVLPRSLSGVRIPNALASTGLFADGPLVSPMGGPGRPSARGTTQRCADEIGRYGVRGTPTPLSNTTNEIPISRQAAKPAESLYS